MRRRNYKGKEGKKEGIEETQLGSDGKKGKKDPEQLWINLGEITRRA